MEIHLIFVRRFIYIYTIYIVYNWRGEERRTTLRDENIFL